MEKYWVNDDKSIKRAIVRPVLWLASKKRLVPHPLLESKWTEKKSIERVSRIEAPTRSHTIGVDQRAEEKGEKGKKGPNTQEETQNSTQFSEQRTKERSPSKSDFY